MPLDPLTPQEYPPLDIMTPIATQRGMPTSQFSDRQRQFERTIVAQHNENRAAINEEAEVRAGADFANALYVNEATAEALGFEASVMVRMEAGVTPAGVLARYQIVGRLVAGGTQYLNGIYFDFIEDPDNPGQYLGQVQIDTDLFKLGRANEDGIFPFYVDGGVVYIENAVIKNLSIGASKVAYNTATLFGATALSGTITFSTTEKTIATQAFQTDDGAVVLFVSVNIGYSSIGASNFGPVRFRIRKNGVEMTTATRDVQVDDSWTGVQTWFDIDPSPGTGSNTYTFTMQAMASGPALAHFVNQGTMQFFGGQR